MWLNVDDGYLYVCDLIVCTFTFTRPNKEAPHRSLHADSLVLLALLPADCHCSLQASLTSQFHHLLVYEVTPDPSYTLAASQLACPCLNAGCLRMLPTDREGNQTLLNKMILLSARKWVFSQTHMPASPAGLIHMPQSQGPYLGLQFPEIYKNWFRNAHCEKILRSIIVW